MAGTNWNKKGELWFYHPCGTGSGYSHVITPNEKACYFGNETSGHTWYSLINASSNHPGGVNAVMLDGSVKFVKDSVSPLTWRAIATKAGDEVVSVDQLVTDASGARSLAARVWEFRARDPSSRTA